MKYIIEKTSAWNNQPIPTAYIEKVHKYDYRRKPRKDEKYPWYEKFLTSNHDITLTEDGLLRGVRNNAEDVWVGEIEDLHKFVEQYGRIILDKPSCEEGLWSVEIYDDYREWKGWKQEATGNMERH